MSHPLARAADGLVLFPILMLMVGLAVASIVWHVRRADAMLRRWLVAKGYTLVDRNYRWFARGPFFWTTTKSQAVFRFTATNLDGDRRQGWARCGSFFFGLLADRVDVRWDDGFEMGGPGFPVVVRDADERR
jgi:hypothetical protein